MQSSVGGAFPSPSQEMLLKAALMDKDVALPAWKQWRKEVDFELDVDHGSFRLLPLTYHNLSSFGYSDDLVEGRLKGIYRQAWIKNQQLFYKTGTVLETLHKTGIKTAVLKGIALTEWVYKNYGIRPMADMDILVPFTEAHHAIDVLKNTGFVLQDTHLLQHNLDYGRGIAFKDADNTEIDLHWHAISHAHENIEITDFWDEVIPIEIAGVKTHIFSATDNLFHTIVHGIRKNPEPPIRWVADAVTIINSKDVSVDWQRLLLYSQKLRVYLQIKEALLYIKKHFGADIPREVIDQINNYKPSYVEKVVYWHGKKIGDNALEFTFSDRVYSFYARYLRQTNREGLVSIHFGLIGYALDRMKARLKE
ncbi:nucleotidyltransferase family protein [Rhodohalobacter sp. 614A]|uniref:nucleotidyltransferase family protein n=1 Tax=Rhodohalobacter sp. 614A TaxID=2908649 RepID=UPI001F474924